MQISSALHTGAGPAICGFKRGPRVILSIRHFYPDGGGAEVSARRMSMRLVRRGIPLMVLTGRYGGRLRVEMLDGVLVRRHFIGLYVPVLHELFYLASLAWELVACRHEYDIVHVFQTQLSALVAVIVAKRLGKKVVTSSRGAGESGDMAVWLSIPGGRRLLRHVSSNVDAATGVSHDVVAELHQVGFDPNKISYIPNGVPIPPQGGSQSSLRKTLGLASDAFIAVFVGRLSVEKGPDFLLSAWMTVVEQYPSSKLLFVGEGPRKQSLERKIDQEGFIEQVLFVGKVDNVNDYLGAADVFILPSYSEGMSVALLEAMYVGLPVVASRVSGTIDVITDGENGLLFDSGNLDGLVECLNSLIESPKRRRELGINARKTVEKHFSLEKMTDAYTELYNAVWVKSGIEE